MKLSEILKEQNDIIEKILESEGEVSPELEKQLLVIDTHLPEKVDAYSSVLDRIANEAVYFDERAAEFAKAAKTLKKAYDRIKDQIKFNMESQGLKKLPGHDYVFSLSNSKGSVVVTNEDLIPDAYFEIVSSKKIDKNAIYTAIKKGMTIPGAHVVENSSLKRDVNKGKL